MLRALRRSRDRRRHGEGEYGWLFHPYTGNEMVAIDCETTGLDTRSAELVSIAAVKVRDGRVLVSESLDLRLQRPLTLTGDSIRIHGLRGIDLEGGDDIREALDKLLDFIGNRPVMGWCLDFDVAIINRHLRRHFGFDLPNTLIEISQDYVRALRRNQPYLTPRPRFEAVARELGVPLFGRHTALGDAVTAALIHLRLGKEMLKGDEAGAEKVVW